jgi:hypothetical protein
MMKIVAMVTTGLSVQRWSKFKVLLVLIDA